MDASCCEIACVYNAPGGIGVDSSAVVGADLVSRLASLDVVAIAGHACIVGGTLEWLGVAKLFYGGVSRGRRVTVVDGACIIVITQRGVGRMCAIPIRALADKRVNGARVAVIARDNLRHAVASGLVARGRSAWGSAWRIDMRAKPCVGSA